MAVLRENEDRKGVLAPIKEEGGVSRPYELLDDDVEFEDVEPIIKVEDSAVEYKEGGALAGSTEGAMEIDLRDKGME